jgi:hypothetical protein
MDWHPLSESPDGHLPQHGPPPGTLPTETLSAGTLPSWIRSTGRTVNPRRVDLALAAVIEQQAQIVVGGSLLAASYPDLDLPGPGCPAHGRIAPPPYLACEVGLLSRLVRLALAAGVDLPEGLPTTAPSALTTPAGFAAARQSCHHDTLAVLTRLSFADDLAASTRDEAHELMRDLDEHDRRSDEPEPVPAPDDASDDAPKTSTAAPPSRGFLPGELLG